MNNKISIIVTYYLPDNASEEVKKSINDLTHECLDSIRDNTFNSYDLILVASGELDNGFYEKVDTVVNFRKTNLGNPLAWDIGVSISQTDRIILMDNDITVEEDWDKYLIEQLDRPEVGLSFAYSTVGDKSTGDIDSVVPRARRDGFLFAFRKEIYDKFGPFLQDQPFKLGYYEDDNFFMSVQNGGYLLVSCPKSQVWHKGKGTSSNVWTKEFNNKVNENRDWYNKKWDSKFPYLNEK